MYSGEPIERAAQRCVVSFSKAGVTVSATVRESESVIDIALLRASRANAVVRCVATVTNEDVKALRTMIAEGDFTRAAIVYADEDQPQLTSEIEAYPLSRIDELAASLARKRLS